jgi:hypothetical protein
MDLSTNHIVGIVLAILIIVIIVIVIMVLVSNAMRAKTDNDGNTNPLIPIILPCFKPCGCHCQRACNCNQGNSSTDSTSSSGDCQLVKPPRRHERGNSSCSSSSSSSGYSCTPDSSSSSSSSSVSISSESISDDSSLSSISFDRKPCPQSDSSSSSSSDFSPFKVRVIPDSSSSSDSKQCHAPNKYIVSKPEPPKLNCLTLKDSKFMATCGRADTDSFIQWYPEVSVDKYTVYVKKGKDTVTATEFDSKYEVEAKHNYFLTPKLAAGPHSFVVTASRFNSDGTEVESDPSEVFTTG